MAQHSSHGAVCTKNAELAQYHNDFYTTTLYLILRCAQALNLKDHELDILKSVLVDRFLVHMLRSQDDGTATCHIFSNL